MTSDGRIVSYTAEEIDAMLARGESKTDWDRVRAMTEEEVERLAEEDDGPLVGPVDRYGAWVNGLPLSSMGVYVVSIDPELGNWFRERGEDIQGFVDSALRAHVADLAGLERK